jgi:hypothetical protein
MRPAEATAPRQQPDAGPAWHQAVLAAEVERVRCFAGGGDRRAAEAELRRVRRDAATGLAGAPALDVLVDGAGLTGFERDTLLLATAAALDPRLPPPTFRLALDVLPDADWAACAPDRPLRSAGLLRPGGGTLLGAPLEVDERVLHHLLGTGALDERLQPYARRLAAPGSELPASRARAAAALADAWRRAPVAVLVHGPDAGDRQDVIALAASSGGRQAWLVDASDLPRSPSERDAFVRLWAREAVLLAALPVLELPADPPPDLVGAAAAVLRRLGVAAAVSAPDRVATELIDGTVEVRRPSRAEQQAMWRKGLRGRGASAAAAVLANGFDLGHCDILGAPPDLLEPPGDGLASARARSTGRTRQRLQGLVERVEPRAGWRDLVLPEEQLLALRRLTAAAAGRARLDAAGFGASTTRGLGVTALFSGPSGTGKTMAAEVVAAELGLDLHRIDLSSVVSKWIGETEKHLRRIFDAAEQGGTVLLFDEADALFGRRSEVRDSHDRYANLEVAYLLTRMESYRGVAVLTTNARAAIDPAFLRRIRVVVAFPHPDLPQRRALWAGAFPPGTSVADLDLDRLAAVDLTGGDIRSAALQAALVAGGEGVPVDMGHLRATVAAELAKHERALAGLEQW